MRFQKRDLPNSDAACPKLNCVYNEDGICDEPRINKGNGDAACFHMSNKDVLLMLGIIKPGDKPK